MQVDYSALLQMAFEARENSVCPYSSFAVGAALLCRDGEVYSGCNIECGAFSATMCAESTAIFKAVSEGVCDFRAIAVVGGKIEDDNLNYCPPCGVCRQVIVEFCNQPDFEIVIAKSVDDYVVYKIDQLLPEAFTDSML
jgi:cytidine deaminase